MDGIADGQSSEGHGARDLAIGQIIEERFLVERVLGRGGASVVVAAVDMTTGQRVAVKFLRAVDSVSVERLLREGRTLASLASDHITKLVHLGRFPSGEPYLVIEFVDGKDLRLVLHEGGPLSVHESIDIILQVCEGIGHAHERGIVHRDIKPGNIIVAHTAGGSPLVKICDFGVSRRVEGDLDEPTLTQTNHLLGTPHYMAPEQIKGAHLSDARADVYSIGAVLYRLLTGEYPFDGTSAGEVIINIASHPTPSLADKRPGAPASLDALIRRCLAKSAETRIQTVGELRELLDEILLEPSVAAASGAPTAHGGPFVHPAPRRHPPHRTRAEAAARARRVTVAVILLASLGSLGAGATALGVRAGKLRKERGEQAATTASTEGREAPASPSPSMTPAPVEEPATPSPVASEPSILATDASREAAKKRAPSHGGVRRTSPAGKPSGSSGKRGTPPGAADPNPYDKL